MEIEGGEMNVATSLSLGNTVGSAWGMLTIDSGGTLRAAAFDFKNIAPMGSNSVIHARDGTLQLNGNQAALITSLIGVGKIKIPEGASSSLDQGVTTPGKTTLRVFRSRFVSWAESWGVDIVGEEDDYDADARNNFYEYCFNGDPTNALNMGGDLMGWRLSIRRIT